MEYSFLEFELKLKLKLKLKLGLELELLMSRKFKFKFTLISVRGLRRIYADLFSECLHLTIHLGICFKLINLLFQVG